MKRVCLFLPVAFAFALQNGALAAPNPWRDRFDREYKDAERRLEEFYSSMQITELQTGESIRRLFNRDAVLFKYQANGAMKRLSRLDLDGQVMSSLIATPAQTFVVRREDANSPFFLKELNLLSYPDFLHQIRNSNQRLAFSPYCIFEEPVSTILFAPGCKLGEVEKTGESIGSALVKVPFDATFAKEGVTVQGWFTFLADRSWAVSDYKYMVYRGEINYSKSVNNIPIPERVKIWREDANYVLRLAEAKEVKLEAAPESEFTLSAFGIPDSVAAPPAVKTRRFWILLSLNLAALGAVLLVLWRRRSQSGSLAV